MSENKAKILLVDDEPDILEIVSYNLKNEGYQVFTAENGEKALKKAGLKVEDIDLFELNEAFSAVVLRFQKLLNIPDEKINVNGGAIAMGHPIGATGAMILGTVLDELERQDKQRALVTLCAGGGIGIATIIERV